MTRASVQIYLSQGGAVEAHFEEAFWTNAQSQATPSARAAVEPAAGNDAPIADAPVQGQEDGPLLPSSDGSGPLGGNAQANSDHRDKALAWARSSPFPRLLIIRNLLVPLQRLQRRHIRVGSVAWEKQQQSLEAEAIASDKGLGRTYPVLLAAECGLEEECTRGLWQLLSQPELWALMPEEACTSQFIGLAHCMVSRAGACVHRELHFLHDRFPFRLFLVIKEPSLASSLKAEAVCSRCPFTTGFLSKFDLETDTARQVLILIAKMLRMNISDVECRHAALRRLLLRVQSRRIDLEALATAWVGQRAKRREQEFDLLGGHKMTEPTDEQPELQPSHAAARVRAPGLWKAFVALESAGQQGRPDLKELGRRYRETRESRPEELAEAQRLADAGRRARAAGDVSRGLGGHHRYTQRVVEQQRDALQLQRLSANLGDPESATQVMDEFAFSNLSLSDALRLARKECRLIERGRLQSDESERNILVGFQCSTSAEAALALLPPGLPDWVGRMHAVPCSLAPTLQFRPPVTQLAAGLVAFAKEQSAKSNLRLCMDAWWKGRHRFVSHDDVPKDGADGEGPPPSPCWVAGVCLCSGRGVLLKRFERNLFRCMKACFRKGTAAYLELRASKIYMLVQGRSPGDLDDDPPQESQFWHIAYLCASPFEFTIQDIVWDGEEGPLGRVTLECTGQWYFRYQAYELCQDIGSLCWSCKFYRIDGSRRPQVGFNPAIVGAFPIDGVEHMFMRPAQRTRRGRPGASAAAQHTVAAGGDAVAIDAGPEPVAMLEDLDAERSQGESSSDSSHDDEDDEADGLGSLLEVELEDRLCVLCTWGVFFVDPTRAYL